MTPITALDAHSEALIERWLQSGRYASAVEVVRDGLRLLEERDKSHGARRDALRAEIQAGLDSGPPEPLDMQAVKAEGSRRLAAARALPADGG